MKVRNSAIGKLVVGSESPMLPSVNEMSQLNFMHSTAKGKDFNRDLPEIVVSKNVVISPPVTDFKVQDYPLKRMNKGMSGWDWMTETNEEDDLRDRVLNCKPTYSTFNKLFPSRHNNLYPVKRSVSSYDQSQNPGTTKEFNIKLDRMSEYRESMLKAHQLFKMN